MLNKEQSWHNTIDLGRLSNNEDSRGAAYISMEREIE